ncbi:MAG: serine hydrolase domain-containing protein, partial [Bacteroidota bacterium]
PGASIAVLRQGETIFERSYGMANLEYDQPMNEQTLVALGSVSKHFTTFALLLLEQRGLLSLEDDIHEYLPELPDYGYPISLREIAWHLSGIRSNLELLGMQGYGPSDALSEDFVRNIIYDQAGLNFPPGSDFSYSNSGYFLLADVISTVSGQDFASFLQAEIFAPLGMEQTFVMNDYAQVLDQRSYSYYQEGDQFVNAIMNRASIGSTGIWTTLADFKKWGQNFSTKSLGNEALFNALCQEGVLNNGRGIQYGLGMAIGTHLGSPLFHHGGGTSGYRTYLAHLPDQDLTILLLSNHGSFNGEAIARSVADLLHPELADSPIATAMPPLDRADLSAEELTIYTGDYLDTNHHFSREIILRDDSLFIQYPWGESWMMPLVNGNFWVAEDRYQIQFPDLATASSYVVYQEGSLEASATYERYDLQSLSAAELAAFTGTFYSEALNVVYRIELNEEQLAIHHSRMGELPLQAYKADHFLVNSWRMNGLQFERDENQKITGFKLSSNRNRGLHFRKI